MAERCPQLRRDLIVRSEADSDQTVYTVKDPITRRYFRLRGPEYYLLTRADGQTEPAEAARLTAERFGIRLSESAAITFFAKMEKLLFFEGAAFERYRTVTPNLKRRSLLLIPLKAFDPNRALDRWVPRLRFLFHPATVAAGLLLMLIAVWIAQSQASLWSGGIAALWQLTSIPLLLVAVFALAWVHETGHALTLKYFGGTVHEMGFLLLYFQPCFYCNISDSYLMRNRWQRLYVGLAGLFFQGLATAAAIMIWRVLQPGNVVSNFLWVFAAVSVAIFLFNFNPLIKLDGYYMLVDWLNIPNLRSKAFRYWQEVAQSWILGRNPARKVHDLRTRRVYRWYGLAAAAYTGILLGWILFVVTRFLHTQWGAVGVILLYGAIVTLTVSTRRRNRAVADKEIAETNDTDVASASLNRWQRPAIVWGGVIVLIILAFIFRLERRVGSPSTVEAGSRFTVAAPVGGTIETELRLGGLSDYRERSVLQASAADFSVIAYQLHVSEGDSVSRGDTILTVSSNRYEAELLGKRAERDRIVAERNLLLSGPKKDNVIQLRAELSEMEALVENRRLEMVRGELSRERELISQEELEAKQAEHEMAKSRRDAKKSELALLISEPKAEELAVKDAQIKGYEAEIHFFETQIAASTVSAPIDGIVTRVERGGILAEISDIDPVNLQLTVDQDEIADVRVGAPVSLKVRSYPYRTFYGRVAHIASDADSSAGRRHFVVITHIENPEFVLRPGMTGHAKIACGERTIMALAARQIIQFFRVEFWSWW